MTRIVIITINTQSEWKKGKQANSISNKYGGMETSIGVWKPMQGIEDRRDVVKAAEIRFRVRGEGGGVPLNLPPKQLLQH